MNNHQKPIALSLLLLATLLLAACTRKVSIADINRDPGRYANADVTVSGHVSGSFAAFGTGMYQIDDGSGSMWVYSQNGVPGNGVEVTVTGRIQQGFSIAGRSYATILRETEQRR